MSQADCQDFLFWLYRNFPEYMRNAQAKILFISSSTIPSWKAIYAFFDEQINELVQKYIEYLSKASLEIIYSKLMNKEELLDYIDTTTIPSSSFLEANESLVEKKYKQNVYKENMKKA